MNARLPDPVDLMMDGKYAEAIAAFERILSETDGQPGDYMSDFIMGQIDYCHKMIATQENGQ